MFRRLLKHALRPVAAPLLNRLTDRVAERIEMRVPEGPLPVPESPSPVPESPPQAPAEVLRCAGEQTEPFDLRVLAAARAVAASGDHRIILPTDTARLKKKPEEIKIGYFGNIANNAHIFTKCLRRLGYRAELVIEDGGFDAFLLNRPFWEDVEVECSSYEEGLTHESKWVQPHYVRRVAYDTEMQARYEGRYSAIEEIQDLYREAFGLELPPDRALLLAQNMGHWPHLLATKQYDVIQYSGAPISMGTFCPKPYVVLPTGSDLTISPFEENLFGLLMRAAYRRVGRILVNTTNLNSYLYRLGLSHKLSKVAMLMDPDVHFTGADAGIRRRWQRSLGEGTYVLSVCRQDWTWKGNQALLRAFASLKHPSLRLILMRWGASLEQSDDLIRALGIESKVLWESLCSKPALRKRQQSADVVVDQFVMPDFGTSVIESLASAKPVIMRFDPPHATDPDGEFPPVIPAKTEKEVADALLRTADRDFRTAAGPPGRKWVERFRGFRSQGAAYAEQLLGASGMDAEGVRRTSAA